MLVLRTHFSGGPQHRHGIELAIRQSSADLLQIGRGSLIGAPSAGTRVYRVGMEILTSTAVQYRLTTAGAWHNSLRAIEE